MRAVLLVVLALAGCTVTSDPAYDFTAANRMCRAAPDVPAWDACIARYNVGMEAREAREAERSRQRDEAVDDAVAAGILIDYATRPRSCLNIGGIVTCR